MEKPDHSHDIELVLELVRARAENLYLTRQMLCSEAVLSVLNQGFGGGMPPEIAVSVASALPDGLGGSGCVCGALNGGMLGLGLFLGRNPSQSLNRKRVNEATNRLHGLFRSTFGSTCCRVLTKSLRQDPKAHFKHCAGLTGTGAKLCAQLILEERPDLLEQADRAYLERCDCKVREGLKAAAGFVRERLAGGRSIPRRKLSPDTRAGTGN